MDVLIDEVNVDAYDALAIPGGFREFGFNEEAFHPKTLEMIRTFHEQKKPIATVCVAAFALAESGILKGKRKRYIILMEEKHRENWRSIV